MHTQLRLDPDFTDDDVLIADMIATARETTEDVTGRALWPQGWVLATDWFPVYRWWDYAPSRSDYDALGNYNFLSFRYNHSQTIAVPRPPLILIDSLTYVTPADGSTQPIDPSEFQIDTISEPGRILPAYGQDLPQAQPQANAVQLKFTAGYARQLTGVVLLPAAYGELQVGNPATFYKISTLVRQDGVEMQPWTVSATGMLTLDLADQTVNLVASYYQVTIPAWSRQAVRLLATDWYEHRSDYVPGKPGEITAAERILMSHRTQLFGYVGRG